MEKTFRRLIDSPRLRNAYVNAEVSTALAHQIRVIRQQRGWSQKELARRLGSTQAAVSRLEDPSYGRLTLQTMLQLSQVFDTGLQVRFVSMVDMLRKTWRPSREALKVEAFEDEAQHVGFVSTISKADSGGNTYLATSSTTSVQVMLANTTAQAKVFQFASKV